MKVLRYFQVFSGISLVICSLLLVTGCSDDFLDRPPLGSLDNTTWINTEDAGSKMLSMCYTPMLSLNFLIVLQMTCIREARMRQIK